MSETPLRGREEGEAAREKQANFCLSWQSLLLLPSSPPPFSLSLTLHRLHNYAKICCATQYFFCFPPSLLAFWTGTATGIFRLPPNPAHSPSACLSFACFPLAPVELAASNIGLRLRLRLLGAHLFSRIIFSALLHFSGPRAGAGAGRDSSLSPSSSSSSSASFWLFYA